MAATDPRILQGLWDKALVEEIGICVKASGKSKMTFVNELYEFRKSSGDPRYDAIIIFTPNDGKVYMVKKAVRLKD